jgi:hypothetical protein
VLACCGPFVLIMILFWYLYSHISIMSLIVVVIQYYTIMYWYLQFQHVIIDYVNVFPGSSSLIIRDCH